ncbi:MAG: rRNA maturation RNase YbeY [Alphaproteobacteria bacterium]|nr:rRNA maturation RNase YbeY [Alphaproteobacteria bacterium]
MIKTEVYICLNEPLWETALPDHQPLAENVVSLAVNCALPKTNKSFLKPEKIFLFNLCLSNDSEVHALNKEFRNKDKATNILSFANIDDPDFINDTKTESSFEMGDMIIALETMQKEADIKKISLHDHFCHLLTHGVLHLLGYDHIQDDEAEIMESLEVEILQKLNINNPYKE